MSSKDFRQSAWKSLKGNWTNCVIAFLIYETIAGMVGSLSVTGVGAVAIFIVLGPLMAGYTKISLNVARGKEADLVVLFDGFKDFNRTMLLYLTNELLIMLWSMLFIIPGIIKSYAYSMSYYILLDNPDISANDARKKSIEMMDGNKWRLFCLDFSFIGWLLLSILTFGILQFWVSPYMEVARAKFYLSLLPEDERERREVNEKVFIDDDVNNSDVDKNDFETFGEEDSNFKNDFSEDNEFRENFDFSNDDDEFKL